MTQTQNTPTPTPFLEQFRKAAESRRKEDQYEAERSHDLPRHTRESEGERRQAGSWHDGEVLRSQPSRASWSAADIRHVLLTRHGDRREKAAGMLPAELAALTQAWAERLWARGEVSVPVARVAEDFILRRVHPDNAQANDPAGARFRPEHWTQALSATR